MRRATWLLLTAAFILGAAQFATAAVPPLINYQGVLRNAAGATVTDSNYSVTFRIFNVPAGGTALWEETQTVTTKNGLFNVLLGSVSPVPEAAFAVPDAYLGTEVSPDAELPRARLTSVAYAFRAADADKVGGMSAGELAYPTAPARVFRAYASVQPGQTDVVFGPTGRVREITGFWVDVGNAQLLIGGTTVMIISNTAAGLKSWSSNGGAPIRVEPNESVEVFNAGAGALFITITGFEY